MNWRVEFLPEAQKDFDGLAGNQRLLVAKALKKVQQNPVSIYDGGYGKPLGNKGGTDLTGLFKIKLRAAGLRVVYKLIYTETEMLIVVVGARADDEVYQLAEKRAAKNNLYSGLHIRTAMCRKRRQIKYDKTNEFLKDCMEFYQSMILL